MPDEPVAFPTASVQDGPVAGVTVVQVVGELDAGTSDDVLAVVLAEAERVPVGLVLDLTGVTFFGSAGITLLVRARRVTGRRGAGFAVVAAHGAVLKTVQVTELDKALAVCPDLDRAVAAVLDPASR
ncbi:STAS domain-containing protein [Saccharothrix sp. NPDC042600]|uniref:STAS domain-containing protein n=1 Tax=Saccharothrix TaxID=2071 RepID=UPI0033C642A6|nr:hypothetical protein GCM10017745_47360 [Saccharothrix mutabilis subsp. capreolus]